MNESFINIGFRELQKKRPLPLFELNSPQYPSFEGGKVEIPLSDGGLILTQVGSRSMAALPVDGRVLAEWPGIDTGNLFDLNVRVPLGMNTVRSSLDSAIVGDEPELFIAAHNGISVMTRKIVVSDTHIILDGVSVVNGAQTMKALFDNRTRIPADLRVIVKIVESTENTVAAAMAIASNTQNPVKTRSMKALDPVQIKLREELQKLGIDYQIRPGMVRSPDQYPVDNGEVAQFICSTILRAPWTAVWRDRLFMDPLYDEVFPRDISHCTVLFLVLLSDRIELDKPKFTGHLLSSWRLTKSTIMFLVGTIFASVGGARWYENSLDLISDGDIILALNISYNEVNRWEGQQDIRTAFKSMSFLKKMGSLVAEEAKFSEFRLRAAMKMRGER